MVAVFIDDSEQGETVIYSMLGKTFVLGITRKRKERTKNLGRPKKGAR